MNSKYISRIFVAVKLIIAAALFYSIGKDLAHIQFKGDQMELISDLPGIFFVLIYGLVLLINAVAELKPAFFSRYLFNYETFFEFLYAAGFLYFLLKSSSLYVAIKIFLFTALLVTISIRNIKVMKSLRLKSTSQ